MSDHKNNGSDEFNDERLARLYRLGAKETAPEHISQHILQASRQFKRKKTFQLLNLRPFILQLTSSRGLAFTAVMVIGISIILQLQFDHPDELIPEELADISPTTTSIPAKTQQDTLEETPLKAEASVQSDTFEEPLTLINTEKPATRPEQPRREEKLQQIQRQQAKKKQTEQRLKKQSERKIKHEAKMQARQRSIQAPSAANFAVDASINEMQLETDKDCNVLSQAACLAAANCTLDVNGQQLICRPARDHCEQGFIQASNLEQLCINKPGCEWQPGHCQCDQTENCVCENLQVPQCKQIPDDNHIEGE